MLKPQSFFAAAIALTLTGGMAFSERQTAIAQDFQPLTEPMLLAQGDRRGTPLLDKLDLSDNQKQEIRAIRQSYRPEFQAVRQSLKEAGTMMETLMIADSTPRSRLEAQHATIVELRQEMGNLHFQQLLDVRDVLTQAQREEIATHMASKGEGDRPLHRLRLHGGAGPRS